MDRERVDIGLVLEIREAVVHEPVGALVAAYRVHDVEELGVRAETPVVLSDVGRREVGPRDMGEDMPSN